MIIIRQKKLVQLLKQAYESGLMRGYSLGWQMRLVDKRNRALIEAEKILNNYRRENNGFK